MLSKSKATWDAAKKDLKSILLHNFGSRFYMQELVRRSSLLYLSKVNAANETGSEYFIAPYTATAQIAFLYESELVHACCGSWGLLLFPENEKRP